ncbi:hypothetical protein K435DRAFT_324978 [Dendrothele bispora CBS 962.96]|uniref:Uncharacterized protein n=1 Tax=Dendrothele bispora (strain CBS 962.96) TaxID=1314807 RepID=A0A4S8LFY0_DENBC|nr:hypothetical protein K435DRAFT_324978 [Dendrothele bispora CBS 962.96]
MGAQFEDASWTHRHSLTTQTHSVCQRLITVQGTIFVLLLWTITCGVILEGIGTRRAGSGLLELQALAMKIQGQLVQIRTIYLFSSST